MNVPASSRTIFDIRERRKALEKQLHIESEPRSADLPNVTAPEGASAAFASEERAVSGVGPDYIERRHQDEVLELRKRLTESESRNVKLQRQLDESEMAREGLEQLHIDLQSETRRQRENQLAAEDRESFALAGVNEELAACRDDLEVFRRLERKLGRYSAIRKHIQSSLIPEDSIVNDETRSDLLNWGTDEEDTLQDLSVHSPHLLEYFQYLTGKVMEYEGKMKRLRYELNGDRDTMERDAAYAEKLAGEVERYEEMISAMDLLHTGYKARITELETGIQTKSDADIALQKVRECLVTYPGGLTALFEAISFDASSLIDSDMMSSSAGSRKDKYPYSNNFEKSRRATKSSSGVKKGEDYGPNFNRLIGGDDGRRLAGIQDDDLPVIVSRAMIHNAAAVAKIPVLEGRLLQQKKEILNLEKLRDGQHSRIKELEWRMRHTEEERENETRRLQSTLKDSVTQMEQQNNFVMNLEDRLDSLNSELHARELNIRNLQKKLSAGLGTAGQAPGEDMTLEDLIDITNNALLYEQQPHSAVAHRDALGHPELVTSSGSGGFPDTPPRSANLSARIKIPTTLDGGNHGHELGEDSTRAKRALERLMPEDPTNIEFKLKQAQAKLSGLKEL